MTFNVGKLRQLSLIDLGKNAFKWKTPENVYSPDVRSSSITKKVRKEYQEFNVDEVIAEE